MPKLAVSGRGQGKKNFLRFPITNVMVSTEQKAISVCNADRLK